MRQYQVWNNRFEERNDENFKIQYLKIEVRSMCHKLGLDSDWWMGQRVSFI